jgi:membrane dipeptidase
MRQKEYSGYKSYQYLEKGIDYKGFKLAKEIGRVTPYLVPVSESEERRVQEILEKCIVISLHDHLRILPEDISELFDFNSQGREFTGYEGVSISGMDAVFDNLLDGSCFITSKNGWKWTDVIYDLGMKLCDVAHQDTLIRCENIKDIIKAHETDRIGFIPALESATMIENELDRIEILYGLGVRMMGIVYSESNSLGTGLKEEKDGGLTYFGRQGVKRMNKIGMAIDVSHSSDQTSLDVFEVSDKPVFMSHAGARALLNIKRLKPDKVLKACGESGGVIGIEAAPHTTVTEKHPEHNIDSVMEHFEYCANLVGIEHVSFGPDTNFGDHVGLHNLFRNFLSINEAFAGKDTENIKEVNYVKGMENPSENFPNIVRWLVKHGYSDEEIEKVIGGNTIRALEKIWI